MRLVVAEMAVTCVVLAEMPAAEEHPSDAGAEEQLFTCRTDETEQRHTENIVLLLFKHGLCAGVVQSERGEQKRKSQCQ